MDQRVGREQAVMVSAWVAQRGDHGRRGVVIANGSDAPVHDVVLRVLDGDEMWKPALKAVIVPPGTYFVQKTDPPYGWGFLVRVGKIDDAVQPIAKTQMLVVKELTFRDSAGCRWARDSAGQLTERREDQEAGSG